VLPPLQLAVPLRQTLIGIDPVTLCRPVLFTWCMRVSWSERRRRGDAAVGALLAKPAVAGGSFGFAKYDSRRQCSSGLRCSDAAGDFVCVR